MPEPALIYNLFPPLVGSIPRWEKHLDRIAKMKSIQDIADYLATSQFPRYTTAHAGFDPISAGPCDGVRPSRRRATRPARRGRCITRP